jgi:transposase
MNVHKNARLTPHGRERIVRQIECGRSPKIVGETAGVSLRTVRKWLKRYRQEGLAGLQDRTSRPHRLRRPTPAAIVAQVETLRRQRRTGQQIAAELGLSPATVSRILKRLGLNKLSTLEAPAPVRRYERERPGELVHIDIKKLGRFARAGHRATGSRQGCRNAGAGWEFVHVAIDDHSRIAFAKVMPSEKKRCAVAFRLLRKSRHQGRAGDDRQWLLLQVLRLPQSLSAVRPATHQNKTLHAENQRKGRALHPDQPARVGLRASLSQLTPAKSRTVPLAAPLQLAQAACRYR